uniref:Integrase core domain containing protein n=1 Tax=Solanum tuberosum TaxID=4113 RepID=M1DAM2_SOLTU
MARDPGTYSEEIVREFYVSYAATLRGLISKRLKPLAQDPLTSTMVRGCPVDISPATISRFLYGPTTVGQAQGGDPSIPDHTDIVPASSAQAASMDPSSSRSAPQLGATVVPLARVQKLEAQIATLLHHIQPWMQKSITESEARMERRMEGMMDQKVQTVNKRLDAFELCILERSAPAIDLSALQAELASLRTDVDAILAAPSVEPQVTPTALADDTVLDALFSRTAEEGLAPTHAKGKRHRSHSTEEEKAQKRQPMCQECVRIVDCSKSVCANLELARLRLLR